MMFAAPEMGAAFIFAISQSEAKLHKRTHQVAENKGFSILASEKRTHHIRSPHFSVLPPCEATLSHARARQIAKTNPLAWQENGWRKHPKTLQICDAYRHRVRANHPVVMRVLVPFSSREEG